MHLGHCRLMVSVSLFTLWANYLDIWLYIRILFSWLYLKKKQLYQEKVGERMNSLSVIEGQKLNFSVATRHWVCDYIILLPRLAYINAICWQHMYKFLNKPHLLVHLPHFILYFYIKIEDNCFYTAEYLAFKYVWIQYLLFINCRLCLYINFQRLSKSMTMVISPSNLWCFHNNWESFLNGLRLARKMLYFLY